MIRVALYNRNLNDPRPSGIKTVVVELLRRLMRDPAQRFHFSILAFSEADAACLHSLFEPGPWAVVRVNWRLRNTRLLWLAGARSLAAVMGRHDLYWSGVPWPFGRRDHPLVVTLHDFFPLHALDPRRHRLLRAASALWFWSGLRAACARAQRIVSISQASAAELRRWVPRAGAAVQVVHNGVDAARWSRPPELTAVQLRARLDLPGSGPFFLSLGAQEPYKNHVRLVEGFHSVMAELGPDATLVIAGPPGAATPALLAAIAEKKLSGRVLVPGALAVAELHAAMCHATAFVFPSLMEGFGIPILEAFAAGTPVITSNTTSMPEVAGEAAVMVDPRQPAQIGAALLDLARRPERRAQLIEAGRRRVADFSWDAAAARYADIFQTLAAAAGSRTS